MIADRGLRSKISGDRDRGDMGPTIAVTKGISAPLFSHVQLILSFDKLFLVQFNMQNFTFFPSQLSQKHFKV